MSKDRLPGQVTNMNIVEDSFVNEHHAKIWAWENMAKPDLRNQLLKELTPCSLDKAWVIQTPNPQGLHAVVPVGTELPR